MLAIDQEVYYIKVEVNKKKKNAFSSSSGYTKTLEPRKFVSMGGYGCICAPRRPFFKIRFQNREKRI